MKMMIKKKMFRNLTALLVVFALGLAGFRFIAQAETYGNGNSTKSMKKLYQEELEEDGFISLTNPNPYEIDLDGDGVTEEIQVSNIRARLEIDGQWVEYIAKDNSLGGVSVMVLDLDTRTPGYEILYQRGVVEGGWDCGSYIQAPDKAAVWKLCRYVDGEYTELMTNESLMEDYDIDILNNSPTIQMTNLRTFTLTVNAPWRFEGKLGNDYAVALPFIYDDEICRFDTTQAVDFLDEQYLVKKKLDLHATYEEDSPIIETVPSGYTVRPLTLHEVTPDELLVSVMFHGKIGYVVVEHGMLEKV